MTTVNTDVIDRVIAVVIVTADRSVTSHANDVTSRNMSTLYPTPSLSCCSTMWSSRRLEPKERVYEFMIAV